MIEFMFMVGWILMVEIKLSMCSILVMFKRNFFNWALGTYKWEIIKNITRIYEIAQVYGDKIFFFGGVKEFNFLAIFNTSPRKNLLIGENFFFIRQKFLV